MQLEDLQALVLLARHGSLQAAARNENLARTTLRRRLDRLEATVGQSLALVGARGIELTPTGHLLLERGELLIAERDRLLRDARRPGAPRPDHLRVLIETGFPPGLVSQVCAMAAAASPRLGLDLHWSPRPLEHLDHGHDVVVHWGGPPPPRDGYSRVIHRATLRAMASPEYLDRHAPPASIEALSEHALLHTPLMEEPDGATWPLNDGGRLPIDPAHVVRELYVQACLVAEGIGIGLVPTDNLGVSAAVERLVPVLPDQIGGSYPARVFVPVRTLDGGPHAALVAAMFQALGDE